MPLDVVLVDGFSGQPGGGAVEVTLDIQLMIALAPGISKIVVYEGPNSGSGLIDTYNRIATDNLAKSISTSWGLSESESAGSIIQSENQIFKQMVAQGQVLYAASGDSGAYDNGGTLSVDDPASQPLVVGVGGTHLNVDGNGNYVSETTWSYGNGPGEGGGGGISSVWSLPTWQQGFANASNLGSTTMRNVPDVALDADPETGYLFYFGGQWGVVGGTSCAAPLWAAFTALVNQQRANNGATSLGFPNPLLYQAASSSQYSSLFHDITVGTNGYYPAVHGYDLATGLGTYIGTPLISYLAGSPSPVCTRANPSVSISPATQTGGIGQTLTYTASITNNDTSACGPSTFYVDRDWPPGFTVTLNLSSAIINPGQTATATVLVTSSSQATLGNNWFAVIAYNGINSSLVAGAIAYYDLVQSKATLSITPQNPSFARNTEAYFKLTLANGTTPISGNPMHVVVKGPVNLAGNGTTGSDGSLYVYFNVTTAFPVGSYQLIATSPY